MKFENTQVWGFDHALRGMRNPKESWDKNDSYESTYANARFSYDWDVEKYQKIFLRYQGNNAVLFDIGPNDMKLAQALIRGGTEHRKFLRQIFVSVDITAPLYWWKEFDTYKVGTVANSTSTMHKLMSKPITRESFEMDDFCGDLNIRIDKDTEWKVEHFADALITHFEEMRKDYLRWTEATKLPTGDTEWLEHCEEMRHAIWKELIRWLPESWLQTRTVTLNYENLLAICSKSQRRFHKLNEWSGKDNPELPNFIAWARTLPYAQDFIFIDELETPQDKFNTAKNTMFRAIDDIFKDNPPKASDMKQAISKIISTFGYEPES